ncbi:MAG: acyl-CoA/acyl-ACP dehydrogenase, partial [Actinobacteria bacterium]|nr:acyl-CoA/acyl-ACP dehydrogenase [Actinomycetota bacterium]
MTKAHNELRLGVREVCARFPSEYWRELDAGRHYPEEFVSAIGEAGYLAALIPEEYGGMGLDLAAACAILEEVNRSGANAGPAHAQMYTMGMLLRHGSEEQKQEYLPKVASGGLRLQAFAVTEPEAGTDTASIRTTATREGDHYVVNGSKIYISRVEHSDLMVLLVRTTPLEAVEKRTKGLSVFLVDLREAIADGLAVRPRRVMMNNATSELVFEDLRVPVENLIGEEGEGFRHVLDGMNAERILISAECIGDGRFFIDKATERAKEREVFGRPIGKNQGVQFPIARAYARVEAASLMVERAASLFDRGEPCGAEANMALLLTADASWEAANTAMQTFGGYGFDTEYDVER